MHLDRNKVKLACMRRGWQLADLAREMGCTRQNLQLILHRGSPRTDTIGRIAKALGVDPVELLTFDD